MSSLARASAFPTAVSAVLHVGSALGRAESSSGGDALTRGASGKTPLPTGGTTASSAPTTKKNSGIAEVALHDAAAPHFAAA